MLLGLDRCSSVMRLRLMIRDRILLWINERSTQIVARHEGWSDEVDYHKKKITFENRRSPSDLPAAIAGSRPEIGRLADVRPLDFTRGSPPRERGIYQKFRVQEYLPYIVAKTHKYWKWLKYLYTTVINKITWQYRIWFDILSQKWLSFITIINFLYQFYE